MPWIHIDDLVGMYLWALDDELVHGTFNATSPSPATNRELSSALGRALHRPAVIPTPQFALRVMLGAEMAENVTTGQRAVPRRALDDGFKFRHTDLGEAMAAAVRA
jgi:NAD dependent epimerase/dehydratase family enzyme